MQLLSSALINTALGCGRRPTLLMIALLSILCAIEEERALAHPHSDPTVTQPSTASLKGASALAAGPMVGFGGHHEVTLWVQTKVPAEVIFRYWPEAHLDQAKVSATLKTGGEDGRTLKVTLSDLKEDTRYQYEVMINGDVAKRPYPQRFITQMRWQRRSPPPDFIAALGSCAYLNQTPQETYGGQTEIFEAIRKTDPHLMLWLGDTVYLGPEDWSHRKGIFRRYARYRAHPDLQPLLASTHHYAIWDDHDYGPNDSNRSYVHKGDSLDAFKAYWGNPSFGLPELPGVFGVFSWSDVDFFLLDNRTYRADNKAPPTSDKDYLGPAQLSWLLDALSGSRATFKLIASGSQVLSPFSRFESYARHPYERQKLLNEIKERGIEGVVFLSGDRHHSELVRLDDDPQFYPLYDFTSSPLTSRPAASSDQESDNPLRVSGTFIHDQRNFGLIKVSGLPEARTLIFEAHGVKGDLLWSHKVLASDLTVPVKSRLK